MLCDDHPREWSERNPVSPVARVHVQPRDPGDTADLCTPRLRDDAEPDGVPGDGEVSDATEIGASCIAKQSLDLVGREHRGLVERSSRPDTNASVGLLAGSEADRRAPRISAGLADQVVDAHDTTGYGEPGGNGDEFDRQLWRLTDETIREVYGDE
jgi:hypothetical protein